MSNTGFKLAGAGANNADAGDTSWANPSNVIADDGSEAWCQSAGGTTSRYLHATNFGFAIPSAATIDGIQVRIQKRESGNDQVRDHTVQLIIGGTRSGDNKADTATNWPGTATNANHGGTADLWGLTPTAAQINSSNFGVAVRASFIPVTIGDSNAFVDAIWIAVQYTDEGGGSAVMIGL